MRYLIGIGNYSKGDDGIGLRIVEKIAENGLNKDFEVIDIADDGYKLLNYFVVGTDRIVLVDAVRMGLEPGAVRVFSADAVTSTKLLAGMSTHEGDVLRVIQMGRDLGLPIPPTTIVGIEPQRMELIMELSEALAARFNEYLDCALNAMKS